LIHKNRNAAVRVQLEEPRFLLRPFGQVNTANSSSDVRHCTGRRIALCAHSKSNPYADLSSSKYTVTLCPLGVLLEYKTSVFTGVSMCMQG
jgi:hypothetical protein